MRDSGYVPSLLSLQFQITVSLLEKNIFSLISWKIWQNMLIFCFCSFLPQLWMSMSSALPSSSLVHWEGKLECCNDQCPSLHVLLTGDNWFAYSALKSKNNINNNSVLPFISSVLFCWRRLKRRIISNITRSTRKRKMRDPIYLISSWTTSVLTIIKINSYMTACNNQKKSFQT